MPAAFTTTYTATPRRSTIATYEAGRGNATNILVIGGISIRPVCEGPLAEALAQAVARGARCTMIDLASRGRSKYRGVLTMDTWLDDLAFIAEPLSDGATLIVGSSMGAWLMLALHERRRLPVRAMCALAPAFDWDTQYVLPGIASGRFTRNDTCVMSEGVALVPNSLLDSMEGFRMLGRPFRADAPIHMILGEDDEGTYGAAREMSRSVTGSECTFESLPGEGHGVAKLATTPARLALEGWLNKRLP